MSNINFDYGKWASVKLLVFPECALTGYPPRDIENSASVKFDELTFAYEQIQKLIDENAIHVICGTITREDDKYYNSAVIFIPHREKIFYHKRALWGWDKDNFSIGSNAGIVEIEGLKTENRILESREGQKFRIG